MAAVQRNQARRLASSAIGLLDQLVPELIVADKIYGRHHLTGASGQVASRLFGSTMLRQVTFKTKMKTGEM